VSAYFVTATGTGIGKTYVTAGLVRHWRSEGIAVAALKPVISGFGNARESDSGVLLEAMGEAVNEETVARISPWRFAAPLSPDMAAAREGREVDFEALLAYCRNSVAAARGPLLIEGVGGVMVPLDGRHTVLDWMAQLGLPAILVAGSYLGTLSHTLTAAQALSRAGVGIAALVLNDSGDGAVPVADTRASLKRFLPDSPIALLARAREAARADFARLAELLSDGRQAQKVRRR
jgi:dethiobiotin synthetase